MAGETHTSPTEREPQAAEQSIGQRGLNDLTNLLNDPEFTNRYVTVQTNIHQATLDQVFSAAVKEALAQDKNNIVARSNAGALEIVSQSHPITAIEEAQKLGIEWGKAKGQAMEAIRVEIRANLLEHPTAEIQEARQKLAVTQEEKRAEIDQLCTELEERQQDPSLFAALEVWGRSPNSQDDRGPEGLGYNAGVIHYFEYRADKGKTGRYKFEKDPFSIQSFIDYSMRLNDLVQNPNPAANHMIATAALIEDEYAQQRLFILTKQRELIVAFRSNGDDTLRVITDFPGQNDKDFSTRVEKELTGTPEAEANRLNRLNNGRKVIPFA